MIIVGLTGVIGSGKSTVSHIFYQSWAHILLTRTRFPELFLIRILRRILKLLSISAGKFLSCDGTINRKKNWLKLFFNNKAELEVLNRITHKYIFL